jgi:hypothetical protein
MGTVTYNAKTGDIMLLDTSGAPMPLEAQAAGITTYRPDGSLRELVSVPSSGLPSVDWIAALSRFEGLIAVDASGPVRGNRSRSIIAMAEISRQGDGFSIQPARIYDVQGIPETVNFEKLGWKLVADDVMCVPSYRVGTPIAIITDKGFGDGEHEVFNRREKEVLPGWELPPGFELVYARDMTPSDSPLQMAIRMCDRLGRDYARDHRELPRAVTGESFYTAVTRYVPDPDKPGHWLPTYKLPKNAALASRQ